MTKTIPPEAAQKAQRLWNAADNGFDALALHIMEFDAFRAEVSEAIKDFFEPHNTTILSRFIIPAPVDNPVVAELFEAIKHGDAEHQAWLKQALTDFASRRGLEVRPVGEVG